VGRRVHAPLRKLRGEFDLEDACPAGYGMGVPRNATDRQYPAAKDNSRSVGDGMQQGLEFGSRLDIPFVFS
jgi:hypothetical protein